MTCLTFWSGVVWRCMTEKFGKKIVRASHIFRVFKTKKIIFWPLYFLISTCFYVLMGFNMLLLCPGSPICYFSLLKPDFCHNFSHFRHILENIPLKMLNFYPKIPQILQKTLLFRRKCQIGPGGSAHERPLSAVFFLRFVFSWIFCLWALMSAQNKEMRAHER